MRSGSIAGGATLDSASLWRALFLTDEVRLHCGTVMVSVYCRQVDLFLTDEVRLHCGPGSDS